MALLKAGTGIGTTSPQSDLHVEGTMTVAGVTTFQSNINLGDNDRLNFYTPNTTIYGSALGLNIEASGNNDITLKSNASGGSNGAIQLRTVTGGKIDLTGTGGVGIYHTDTAKKLETIGTGATVTGDLHVSGDLIVAGSKTSIGSTTFTGSAGTPQVVDEFTFTDLDAAEYTLKVGFGTYTQVQKVLLMTHDATTTAYTEEYGIMYQPSAIVSIGATVSAGNCQLLVTPVTGVSGVITCKFQREGIS